MYDSDAALVEAVGKVLGCRVTDDRGHLDRRLLASLVFNDRQRLEMLESVVHPRVSVGLDFGYGYGSADMYITDSDAAPVTSPIFVCRSAINSYSAHVSASYTYWQQGPMECSGALYLGVSYQDESIERSNEDYFIPEANDRLRFSYHITAIKFRYGETFGGFAELGFGYRGLVNVGLSIKI